MNKYYINFKRLALLLLPTYLRKPVLAALVYAIIEPLSELHVRFLNYRSDALYKLTHNGQVCYLEALLNDSFDAFERRITITDIEERVRSVDKLYRRELELPVLVPERESYEDIKILRRELLDVNSCDFYVNVPADKKYLENDIRFKAVLNNYKLVSKYFKINVINDEERENNR